MTKTLKYLVVAETILVVALFVYSIRAAYAASSLFGGAFLGLGEVGLVSDLGDFDPSNDSSGVSFDDVNGEQFSNLAVLSTDFDVTDDDCFGGSPRFQIAVDANSDTVSDGNVFVYLGPPPSFSGCSAGSQNSGNLIGNEDAGRWDYTQLGGPLGGYSGAPANVMNGTILDVSLVVDSGWGFGDQEQTVFIDNVTIAKLVSATYDFEATDGTLTLLKAVVNDNGGGAADTDWTLSAAGPTPISGAEGDATITNASVAPGTYDLSEAGPAGYTPSAWVCVGGNQTDPDTVVIAAGEQVTCTITNDDVPPAEPPANACDTPNVAPAGFTLVVGTTSNDNLTIAPFSMFVGLGGNDVVSGPADGNYIVCLEDGFDKVVIGNGNFTIAAGDNYKNITTGNGDGVIVAGNGNNRITTGNGQQTITTGNGSNAILTGDGDKTIMTGSGNDRITTGSGNDVINADSGYNRIQSGAGNDNVTTGALNDNIDGGANFDTCNGGGNFDTIVNCEA